MVTLLNKHSMNRGQTKIDLSDRIGGNIQFIANLRSKSLLMWQWIRRKEVMISISENVVTSTCALLMSLHSVSHWQWNSVDTSGRSTFL